MGDGGGRLATATASAPAQPAASTDIPAKPNYVTSEVAKAYQDAGGTGTVVEELKPFAAVVDKTENS